MIYEITVKPNSKKGPLIVATDNQLIVYLREKPIDGEANVALVKHLAKYFGVSKSRINIKTGARGRQKLVEIV